ncbi:MAG TPA: amidase [Usitatibacter sp.]|nr:amidase [Usitatibacter sp.]
MRVAVKDNIAVAGQPFTAGLPMFASRVAQADAAVVARLRAAGASIVGVTATDSGGLGVATPEVINPLAPELIAGGSSGGSAAAVASGIADVALGTDTGGSVRIPAACCGVFGFKPSHGRVPATGVWPLAPELEDVGVLAGNLRSLERAAHLLMDGAPAPAPSSVTIGVDRAWIAMCDPSVAAGFEAALARTGCRILEVRLPDLWTLSRIHATLVLANVATLYGECGEAGLGKLAWRCLESARGITADEIARARASGDGLRAAWTRALGEVDFLLLPTLPAPVPLRGTKRVTLAGEEHPIAIALTLLTAPANLFGAPAIALPIEGESLQLVAVPGRDEGLLAAAGPIHAMLAMH